MYLVPKYDVNTMYYATIRRLTELQWAENDLYYERT